MVEMAMFPLGTVLLPGMVLPLHLFEPRYRTLARHVVHGSGDSEFGVALIERGSEVGGGDVRSRIGVIARVVQAEEFDDGRWGVVGVGTDRIRIEEWLDDDPYPRALVDRWDDEPERPGDEPVPSVPELEVVMGEIRELARRLGHDVSERRPESGVDLVSASWQLIARSPLGPSDRQRLLSCPTRGERLRLTARLLVEQRELLDALLAAPDD